MELNHSLKEIEEKVAKSQKKQDMHPNHSYKSQVKNWVYCGTVQYTFSFIQFLTSDRWQRKDSAQVNTRQSFVVQASITVNLI